MKTNLLRLLLIFNFSFFISGSVKSQLVLIPDTNFRNFLMTAGYSACMSGDYMDISCPAVISATSLDCSFSNIYDLTGIENFVALQSLNCRGNYLVSLTQFPPNLFTLNCGTNQIIDLLNLPSGLTYLNCGLNQSLVSLPALPDSLEVLICYHNALTSLPILPPNLLLLECFYNQLSNLPSLPSGLTFLNCSQNQISTLPQLPVTLETINCSQNQLTSLPVLPDSLIDLNCGLNQLVSIPVLPNNLQVLSCSANDLDSIPTLPNSLLELSCASNNLTALPVLPLSLNDLYCSGNLLTVLPVLPDNLQQLICSDNQIPSIPTLPDSLTDFRCDQNLMSALPNLPPGLKILYCHENFLTSLPAIPYGVTYFSCFDNQLTSIPNFPDSSQILIYDNPITCLPELKKSTLFYWWNTNVTCLPNIGSIQNSDPLIDTVPLCDPFSLCPLLWNISGTVYFDADSSCVADSLEIGLIDIPVILDSGGVQLQKMYTDGYGRYSFQTGYGNYVLKVDTTTAPYRVICPAAFVRNSVLTVVDSLETDLDFGLLCKTGFDLVAKNISPSTMLRPGFQSTVYINAGDGMSFSGIDCATAVSGSVEAILSNLVSYISPAPGALTPSFINGDTIRWNIADFTQVAPQTDFNIIIEVSTSATLNDSICIELNVSPAAGDNIPSNNTLSECYPVRGSFDPNEKYMTPSGLVDTSQQWFEFTIFFQNVGTAPAEDIYILDTLDQNLDATTFTYLSSSHDVITQLLPGNILRFNYPDINLADSTTDEPESHGFVKFKVKRQENLPVNTSISNTAHIYFDFNAAVVTNTTQATLTTSVGMKENVLSEVILYPNPARSLLTVNSKQYTISSIEILNTLGQSSMTYNFTNAVQSTDIDISGLQPGVYFLSVKTDSGTIIRRFIKYM